MLLQRPGEAEGASFLEDLLLLLCSIGGRARFCYTMSRGCMHKYASSLLLVRLDTLDREKDQMLRHIFEACRR